MKKSYLTNYLKLYFWQFFAIILNFAAMLIVLPIISKNSELFGIYSLCISITIFLSYANLGFVSAGMKYASEFYSRNELKEEVEITGFVIFVLLIGMIPYVLCMLWFWYEPTIIMSGLSTKLTPTASSMFLILALFSPNILFQKASLFIYGIRVEDFVTRQINIIGHITKIISIYYFFNSGQSDIVGYFFFFQFVNLLCFIAAVIVAGSRYQYPLAKLISSIRFSSKYFHSSKNLALVSFYGTIAWVLYFELDNPIIGKIFGIHSVAIYAIGFSILSFLRSIFTVIFSPLSARFNHFVGVGDYDGLKLFYRRIMLMLFPILTIPVITIIVLMKYLVLCWVGEGYTTSIPISQFLVATFLFVFITYPTAIMLMALERKKLILGIDSTLVFVYWSGIFLTENQLGLLSFSVFKFIAYIISVSFFAAFSIKFLNHSAWGLAKSYLLSTVGSILVLIGSLYYLQKLLPIEKSTPNLLIVIATGGIASMIAITFYFILNRNFKGEIILLANRVKQLVAA